MKRPVSCPWPRHLWLALCLVLAACADLGGVSRVQVLGGAVTVAAPSGYCVAPGRGDGAADTAVVLIGRCQAAGQVAPAVISVSLGRAGSGGVMAGDGAALAAFFESAEGRTLLARSGRAEDLQVLAKVAEGGTLFLHLSDAGSGEYWRVMLALGGRLVTISAQGTEGLPLTPAASRAAVAGTLAAIRAANPVAQVTEPVLPSDG